LYEVECGINVGGHLIKTVRFADDKAVVASSEKGLQELIDNIIRVTQKYGMTINVKITKVMCIARPGGGRLRFVVMDKRLRK